MTNENETKGKSKDLMGKVKEAVGDLLGNEKMQAEGKADQVEGKTQETAGKVQDAVTPDKTEEHHHHHHHDQSHTDETKK